MSLLPERRNSSWVERNVSPLRCKRLKLRNHGRNTSVRCSTLSLNLPKGSRSERELISLIRIGPGQGRLPHRGNRRRGVSARKFPQARSPILARSLIVEAKTTIPALHPAGCRARPPCPMRRAPDRVQGRGSGDSQECGSGRVARPRLRFAKALQNQS